MTVNLYDNGYIPRNTTVGSFCDIGSVVGQHSKIQCHVSIPPGWKLGDKVFYGPGCRLANDRKPDLQCSFKPNGGVVEDDVVIGMGALIGAGVTLGKGCTIGMGAVVTKDVPAGETWVGNPAHKI
jgi:acetyltransferase-like isoleucine patch superfamily enzyme